jgi:hypothetical protein
MENLVLTPAEYAAEKAQPKPSTQTLWNALTPAEQSYDYIRRIHWWVRLFGFVCLVVPAMMVLGFVVILGYVSAKERVTVPDSAQVSKYLTYADCLNDPATTYAECKSFFPADAAANGR